jgi:hypothetical protein
MLFAATPCRRRCQASGQKVNSAISDAVSSQRSFLAHRAAPMWRLTFYPSAIPTCASRAHRGPGTPCARARHFAGFNKDGNLQIIIEMPKGSRNNYKYEPELG